MPILCYQPLDRRSFLKTILGGTALALTGCRTSTPSSASRRELPLALLSDTHVPGDRQNSYRGFKPWDNLREAVSSVIAMRPEGVVLNGDNARLEGKAEDYRELQVLLGPALAATPVYIGLGNHDDRAHLLNAFRGAPGMHPPVDGRHVTVVEHDVVRVIILDSLLYTNKVAGLLGSRQRDWLAGYLPGINDRPAVLVVHHTLGQGDGDLLDTDWLFALVHRHRHVKAIFYGHSHAWHLGQRQGLNLVNLPAVGYNFRDQDPLGWVEARFRRDGVALTLRAIAGFRGDDGKTTFISWRS